MGQAPATNQATKPDEDDGPPGMDTGELRSILKQSQGAPLSAAFAVGKDGKAMLQLHRRRRPRALARDMEAAAPDCRILRFGTASEDPDQPGLLRFRVNRAAAGVARKLIAALRGTGFNKVEIISDDGEAPERAAEDADAPPPADDTGTASAGPAKGPSPGRLVARLTPLVRRMVGVVQTDPSQRAALQELARSAQSSLQRAIESQQTADFELAQDAIDRLEEALDGAATLPSPAPAAKRPGPDPQALAAALTDLAKRAVPLMQADPAGGTPMKQHLTNAQAALKAGALEEAAAHTQALRELIAGGHNAPPGAKLFVDLAARWQDAERRALDGVKQLKAALDDLYDGDPAAAQMETAFAAHARAIFGQFDGALVTTLRKASATKNAAELGAAKAELRHAVAGMITFLKHDSLALIDSNPIVSVDIMGPCKTALQAMLSALG